MVNQSESVVQINSGKIQGELKQGIYSFKGIPYAAPPTDEQRWHPPRPCIPWE